MKKSIIFVVLAIMVISLLIGPASVMAADQVTAQAATITKQAFHDQMRELWEQHVWWTRVVIMDVFASANATELNPEVARLFKNQDDIGNAFKPYYGDANGAHLTALLHTHIQQAYDLLLAAMSGNTTLFDQINAAWYQNGEEIADFLTSLNPKNWPGDLTDQMMDQHLDLTLAEATARLKMDGSDVAAFDAVQQEILMMADVLSNGIMAQFPMKFSFGFKSRFLETLVRLFGE